MTLVVGNKEVRKLAFGTEKFQNTNVWGKENLNDITPSFIIWSFEDDYKTPRLYKNQAPATIYGSSYFVVGITTYQNEDYYLIARDGSTGLQLLLSKVSETQIGGVITLAKLLYIKLLAMFAIRKLVVRC